MHLTTGKTLFINRNAERVGNAVDVGDVEMDECVRPCVTLVLREVDVDASAFYGHKPRETRLELMLPFLRESEPLVPGDSARRVLNVENRHDLLDHAAESTARVGEGRVALGQFSGMSLKRLGAGFARLRAWRRLRFGRARTDW